MGTGLRTECTLGTDHACREQWPRTLTHVERSCPPSSSAGAPAHLLRRWTSQHLRLQPWSRRQLPSKCASRHCWMSVAHSQTLRGHHPCSSQYKISTAAMSRCTHAMTLGSGLRKLVPVMWRSCQHRRGRRCAQSWDSMPRLQRESLLTHQAGAFSGAFPSSLCPRGLRLVIICSHRHQLPAVPCCTRPPQETPLRSRGRPRPRCRFWRFLLHGRAAGPTLSILRERTMLERTPPPARTHLGSGLRG